MLLSSQADFKYDDQSSSSNPPAPPPEGDGNSGLFRNIFNGSFGFGGGRSSGNQGSSRNDNERYRSPATRGRSQLDTKPLSREDLREFALGTLRVLDDGEYFPPGTVEPYELTTKIRWSEENTRYYGPDAGEGGEMLESEFARIDGESGDDENEEGDLKIGAKEEDKNSSFLDGTKQREDNSEKPATTAVDDNLNSKSQVQAPIPPDPKNSAAPDTPIYVGEYSTLIGARKVHFGLASNMDQCDKKIGILNFASAKKPGGGFINGSQAQEESIARASTLYPSLITPAANEFYKHYREDPKNAYYTHAMVYSPAVLLLRDDSGEWRRPVEVDVLTSAAVNAGEIRRELEREERERRERVEWEIWKKRGEERRREVEKAAMEKERVKREKEKAKQEKEKVKQEKEKAKQEKENEKQENENEKQEKEKLKQEKEKLEKEKVEVAALKKEKAELTGFQREMMKSGDENQTKETEKGEETDSRNEKEETSLEQEKADAEVEEEKEEWEWEEIKAEKLEENQEEKATDSSEGGSSADTETKKAEESKGASIQDDQAQPEAPPEVIQEPTSSTTTPHPLSPQIQASHIPEPDSDVRFAVALSNAETQIQFTMYNRISRILHLFQLHQTPHLILGSFGTGVFQNRIELVATIFADLLVKPGGRFKNVFKTVVFAILGKETVRGFQSVFSRIEKRAQRERGTDRTCVFFDDDGSDGDVREGKEEKRTRMMRWRERKTALADAARAEAEVASFVADEAAYLAAQAAAQAAALADAAHIGAASAVQTGPAVDDNDKIAEDGMMILTNDDGKVDFGFEEETAKAMIIDDGKDFEMVEINSLSASYHEDQISKLEDVDVEMATS